MSGFEFSGCLINLIGFKRL